MIAECDRLASDILIVNHGLTDSSAPICRNGPYLNNRDGTDQGLG
jgi:hypothetical protein